MRLVSGVVIGCLSDGIAEDKRGISVICERHVPGHNGETGLVVGTASDLSHL